MIYGKTVWGFCYVIQGTETMIPFKSTNFLRQYNPNKNHKWGFKIWERSGIRGILYDFEVYTCQSNNKETRFGVSGDAVDKLASTLPENENYKIFADNFLTNLLLIAHLNSKGIWYVRTASLARLKTCPLMAHKDLKKKDRGSFDHCFEENRGIIVVNNPHCFIICSTPIDAERRYDLNKATCSSFST